MEKLKDRLEFLDAPIKAKSWRNLWFLNTGESFYGYRSKESEAQCIIDGDRDLREAKSAEPFTRTCKHASKCLGRTVYVNEASHYIPMPVQDA